MPIHIADNPLQSVAIGSGQALEEFDALRGVLFRTGALTSAKNSMAFARTRHRAGPAVLLVLFSCITL